MSRFAFPCLLLLGLASSIEAQGSFTPFGSGCPGSGSGGNTPGVILPASLRTRMGGSGNYYGVSRNEQRYQQVFLNAEVGKPTLVLGYALRHTHSNSGGSRTYRVTMGYTQYDHNSLTTSFDGNFDKTVAPRVVLNGQVNLPQLSGNNSIVDRFPFEVKFAQPWVWAAPPNLNLLWQLEILDTVNLVQGYDYGSGINTTRLYSTALTATTGTLGTGAGLAFKLLTPGGAVNPVIGNTGLPSIGKQMQVELSQARANSAAALITGFSNQSWASLPLPLDLAPLGATGCSLLVSVDVMTVGPTDGNGDLSLPWFLPNDAGLRGVRYWQQWFVLDPAANGLGLAWSNGAAAVIG